MPFRFLLLYMAYKLGPGLEAETKRNEAETNFARGKFFFFSQTGYNSITKVMTYTGKQYLGYTHCKKILKMALLLSEEVLARTLKKTPEPQLTPKGLQNKTLIIRV